MLEIVGLLTFVLVVVVCTIAAGPRKQPRRQLRQTTAHVDRVLAEARQRMNRKAKGKYGTWQEWL